MELPDRPNPLIQFQLWFEEAHTLGLRNPNAMALASSEPNGKVNCRMVLLKKHSERGFVFFTNYHSQKGQELENHPTACLLFYWDQIGKQVRIRGPIEKCSPHESDEYFYSRSRDSQISALISHQSKTISSREELEANWKNADLKYRNQKVPRPENWGGYRLLPEEFEFWQEGAHRLHDRFLYSKLSQNRWEVSLLSP